MNSNTYISVSIFFSTKQLFDYNSECVRVDNLKMHLIIFVNVTSESQKKIPSAVVIQYRAWYLFLRLRCYIPGIILVSARLLRIALNTLVSQSVPRLICTLIRKSLTPCPVKSTLFFSGWHKHLRFSGVAT